MPPRKDSLRKQSPNKESAEFLGGAPSWRVVGSPLKPKSQKTSSGPKPSCNRSTVQRRGRGRSRLHGQPPKMAFFARSWAAPTGKRWKKGQLWLWGFQVEGVGPGALAKSSEGGILEITPKARESAGKDKGAEPNAGMKSCLDLNPVKARV